MWSAMGSMMLRRGHSSVCLVERFGEGGSCFSSGSMRKRLEVLVGVVARYRCFIVAVFGTNL